MSTINFLHELRGQVSRMDDGAIRSSLDAPAAVPELLSAMGHLARRLDDFRTEYQDQSEARLRLGRRIRAIGRSVRPNTARRNARRLHPSLAGCSAQLRAMEELVQILQRGLVCLNGTVVRLGAFPAQFGSPGDKIHDSAGEACATEALIREIQAELFALEGAYAAREERLARLWQAPARRAT